MQLLDAAPAGAVVSTLDAKHRRGWSWASRVGLLDFFKVPRGKRYLTAVSLSGILVDNALESHDGTRIGERDV